MSPDNFLDSVREYDMQPGICRTCGNITEVKKGLLGCKAHDKIIMPEYPPYFYAGNQCNDWKPCEAGVG